MNNSDKLIQVFACEMLDPAKEQFVRGKLYLMERAYHFCPLISYAPLALKLNSQIHKIKYSQISQIDTDDNADSITITSRKGEQFTFRNFFAQRPQVLEILHQCNEALPQEIPEMEHFDWEPFAENSARLLPLLVQLIEGNQYNKPTVFMLEGVELHDIFTMLYDDKPYRPSQFFKYESKQINYNQEYQNILHFLFEQIMGDKNFESTPWQPPAPQYLRTGQVGENLPMYTLENVPTKRITYTHPTQLPFFGTIKPTVNMTQRLLLLNEKEFIIQVTSETKGIPYCENYRMMSHERVIQKGNKKFQIECTFTIEWKKRIILISNQVDQAGQVESQKVLQKNYIPFANSRLQEILSLQRQNSLPRPLALAGLSSDIGRRVGRSETAKVQNKFVISSARNLDKQNQFQQMEQNYNMLEQRVEQLAKIILVQDQTIKYIQSQQSTLVQITRVCVGLCALFLFVNWFVK